MLVIRKQQIESVNKERQAQFKKKVHTFLQDKYRDFLKRIPQNEIDNQINVGIKKALTYHISTETSIVSFILLTFIVGIDFDNNPNYGWAQKILTDDQYSEKVKIEKLIQGI